ncbi:MAG: hypothetical protein BA863_18305 [Desulfovibrio sp. S3730MH75]|nr:MAG: hypothetical protein BA863_18305 [Desulfovibrio sp. S3730MH75]
MEEKRVLVAGGTGYLGQFLVKESKRQGYWVRALTRNPEKLAHLDEYIDDLFVGEVTDPDSIVRICEDIDFVISAVGITRQKDGLTYMDVDYQGNRNLMDCAISSGVSKFVYVSVLNAHLMSDLKIIQAKEKFARELEESNLDHTIVRPTGFFSDMLEFLHMARKGKVSLFGTGDYKINPIHGQDLAEVCVAALGNTEKEIEVGGPETYTHKQIAELAFEVLHKKERISYMPLWLMQVIVRLMRLFTSSKTYGPIEFLMTALTMDGVAPAYGKEKLRDFYKANAEKGSV